jgi:ketosteroid isomerase-like protein
VSEENIALVEAAFEAWNRREVEAFAKYAAEDVVWLEVSGRPEGDGAEAHGRARLQRSLTALFEVWETYRLEPRQIFAVDADRVVAVLREVARGRASGVEVDSLWGYVITLADGQIARVEAYRDHAMALDVVGLRRGA